MILSRPLARLWRASAATPLRVKLVATVLLLAAVGLGVAAAAITTSLHSYLINRVDDQLRAAAGSRLGQQSFDRPPPAGSPYLDPRAHEPDDTSAPPLPSAYYVVQYLPDGSRYGAPRQASLQSQSPPRLPVMTTTTAQRLSSQPFTVSSVDGHASWRVIARVHPDGSGSVVIATSLADTTRTIHRVMWLETGIGLAALLFMGLAGYVLIRRALRPLVSVEHTAAAIAAGDLTQRVPTLPTRTEVGRLAAALNGMLTQIERAFDHQRASQRRAIASEERMRQFVADASHELRTPLTSIRGFAELYRLKPPAAGDLPRMMRRIEDEASRMGLLVDDLLLLARLDQERPLESEPVDLLTVVADAVHGTQAIAPDRAVSLDVDAASAPVVIGDEARLRQVVANLLGNAVTHTPTGTPIDVRIRTDSAAGVVLLTIADRGPGIPTEDATRIFERFYRTDVSRSRAAGGTGLGLSIVASLVAAHRGSVGVRQRDGGGAEFTVTLPLASGG